MQSLHRWMAIPLVMSGVAFSGAGVTTAEAQETQNDVLLRTARFWRGDSRTLLEGVVGLPIATTTRSVELFVRDSTGKVLHSENWTDSANANASALAALNAESATRLELLLLPGAYTISARRTEGGQTDSATMLVRGFSETPVLSDVMLSARMRVLGDNEEPQAHEMKRGRYAIERGARVTVLPNEPRLWYYVELYQQGADSLAQLTFRVLPPNAENALVTVNRQVKVTPRGTVDAAALVVQGLPPGQYRLVVTAKSGGREATREAMFSMASWESVPVAAAAAPGATVSESALMDRYFTLAMRSDVEANAMIEALTVSAPADAVSEGSVSGLTTDARRRFLARYWSRVPDPNPATQQHEVLEEYSERIRFVMANFTEQRGRSAIKTDRGRIYLRYGAPDARQEIRMGNNRSVDIWKYTRRRTIKFAFLDETGFSNFNMIYAQGDPTVQSLADWADRVGPREQEAIRAIINF